MEWLSADCFAQLLSYLFSIARFSLCCLPKLCRSPYTRSCLTNRFSL